MSRKDSRIITKRIIITGNLVLQTPANLGSGDAEGLTDMPLLQTCDATGKSAALLTGSSIAGALRNYVRAYEQGFFEEESREKSNGKTIKKMAELLFGGIKSDDDGVQSPLIVCDATSENPTIELRDGVKINPSTRTPVHQGKYDLELLAAGTTFKLQFELAIAEDVTSKDEQELRTALAIALFGLQHGEIAIGMKKRRGFGQCHVLEWHIWEFDMHKPTELLQWLAFERNYKAFANPNPVKIPKNSSSLPFIMEKLGLQAIAIPDQRHSLLLKATFDLYGSMLIRSGQDEAVLGPDVRHLHAKQVNGTSKPVVSGTSLAGVVRHRAERIVNTILQSNSQGTTANSNGKGATFINELFGYVDEKKKKARASRIVVHEREMKGAETNLVQNRIAIDRFTGGAYEGALFNEQPAFAKPNTTIVELSFELFEPTNAQIGLLLLLLKDLWSGDLPIGGESSIGRGRLYGKEAILTERHNGQEIPFVKIVRQSDETLEISGKNTTEQLNGYVTILHNVLKEEQ